MCSAPSVPAATQFQQAQDPIRREAGDGRTGRRGTILTGGSGTGGGGSSPIVETQTLKKTALGS